MPEILHRLTEGYWHLRGFSGVEYSHILNLRPKDGVPRCYVNSVSHTGVDTYAMDIIIPNPDVNRLTIFAPASGIAGDPITTHSRTGTEMKDSWAVNTIRVYVSKSEYYEIKHFQSGSCDLRLNDQVSEGQPIALTGGSGFYTDESFHHVHFSVHGIKVANKVSTFPLRVRFKEYNLLYGDDGSAVFVKK